MKKIFFGFVLAVSIGSLSAQSLLNAKWKISENGIAKSPRYGIVPILKPIFIYFHKDSLANAIDYSKVEMRFLADSTYSAINDQGAAYKDRWHLNNTRDSIFVDSAMSKFDFIDKDRFVTSKRNVQVVDTIGTKDTTYNYLLLYRIPDVVTSTSNAFFSEDIRLSPNPAKNEVVVNIASEMAASYNRIIIRNVLGKELMRQDVSFMYTPNHTLYIGDLTSGIYFVELISMDAIMHHRTIKLIKL